MLGDTEKQHCRLMLQSLSVGGLPRSEVIGCERLTKPPKHNVKYASALWQQILLVELNETS